ncbi:MAG: nucleoside monophosphate kinase [Candidatus Kaiserbacteria bacterium]|nr:MAG: nucleoside monophosphate kinase [Candidatus Kaiserbacteria bacterium]
MQPITVAFFGISGSGKGTQCVLLEKFLQENDASRAVVRPEMGDLLRTFMQSGTSLAKATGEIVNSGGLVPSFIPIYMLTGVLNESFDGTQHLILDGTCRRPDQSRAVDEMMRLWKRENLQAIVLTLSRESAKKRLIARGRVDDAKDEALASRFAWYEEHVVPSIEELRTLGWTIHEVDGEPEVETVQKEIRKALGLTQ